jgi:hypothetical protein
MPLSLKVFRKNAKSLLSIVFSFMSPSNMSGILFVCRF